MYKCKHFKIKELVSPAVFKLLGEEAWKLFNMEFLITIDTINEVLDCFMICNNKDWKYRGYREQGCGVGKIGGAHYKGLGGDFTFYDRQWNKIESSVIVERLLENRAQFPYLAALEVGVSWNHVDCMTERYSGKRKGIKDGKILLFGPEGVRGAV